jgi:UDP-N-acetylmuramate dehydrogenase
VPLAGFTTLGVGGPAQWFAAASSVDDVQVAREWAVERGLPLFVLGGGSNLVIADTGVAGVVMHMRLRGVHFHVQGGETFMRAGAGEPWDRIVEIAVGRGVAGLECLSGIPGSVGGTPIQNVGAYGQEVGDSIDRVTVFDQDTGDVSTMAAQECGFSYRMSRFKSSERRHVVCDVTWRLRAGAPTIVYPDVAAFLREAGCANPTLADVRQSVLAIRRRKGMVLDAADPDTRSVGSFFMNPIVTVGTREEISSLAGAAAPGFAIGGDRVKVPAAWLIERAGFQKGMADGAAGISTKHPLALVNRGGATARDVVRLAVRIRRQVLDRFGVALRPEPVFAGFDGDPDVEYLTAI